MKAATAEVEVLDGGFEIEMPWGAERLLAEFLRADRERRLCLFSFERAGLCEEDGIGFEREREWAELRLRCRNLGLI